VLFRGLDALENYLDNVVSSGDEGEEDNEDVINDLNAFLNGGSAAPDKKAETSSATPAASDEDMGESVFANMKIADFEQHAIEKAKSEEQNVYEIRVVVEESCILKAARAFLVFKALEDIGDVIKSVPDVQDIEDERFEQDFSVLIITKESADVVKNAILAISEIAKAIVRPFDLIGNQGEKTEEKAASADAPKAGKEASASGATATATAPAAKKQNAADKKAASKPVVNRSVRVDIEKLDVLMNLVSELIIAKNGLVSLNAGGEESKSNNSFNEQIEYLERVTTNLHESVMKVRMMPIESVVNKFPRMIRDLTKKLDKKMELYMTGEETELDRTVIDEIGDPLMHLLRNSADHGLESNEDRIKAGKPEVGSIFLDAYQDGNNVVIEVRDDGAGIDLEKVKNKAIEKGVITDEQAETMTDNDLISLLFKPSFSTADKVTDVSGRGVGLDVVKSKIEGLGGDIECKTVRGEGSTFTIRLPLTLAIITALMVELGDEKYAIPLGSIQTIEDIPCTDVKYVQGREVINLRGTVIPLIRLDSILDVQPREEVPESLTVVIVAKGEKLAGLVVDNLIGQQEIVIKSIGKYINNNKIISGATILGDGEVALIIDANTLV